MKTQIILIFILFINAASFGQDFFLVIDEQFGEGKELDKFDDDTYSQVPGDLHWQVQWGEGFGFGDVYADLDGTGAKNWRMTTTADSMFLFVRPENVVNEGDYMEIEANAHGTYLGEKVMSAATLVYPWEFNQGFFEMRVKLPYGQGIISSWFLNSTRAAYGYGCEAPANGEDENWQEIDVWEQSASYKHTLRNNIHWSPALDLPTVPCDKDCGDHCQNAYSGIGETTELNFHDDFHTIGLYWDQWFVAFFIDGYLYRYWLKKNTLSWDPIDKNLGDPDPLIFLDAMKFYVGTGYGIGDAGSNTVTGWPKYGDGNYKDFEDIDPSATYGPHPEHPIPSSELVIDYFRYWVFIPDEDLSDVRFHDIDGTTEDPLYATNKTIDGYHLNNRFGHFETGKNIICQNSEILPTYDHADPDYELPFAYSDQLNLIASNSIILKTGFHAKAAEHNYPIEHQFKASIKPVDEIPAEQTAPLLNFLDDIGGDGSDMSNFYASLRGMIQDSYTNDGPFKLPLASDEYEDGDYTYFMNEAASIGSEEESKLVYYPTPNNGEFSLVLSTSRRVMQLIIRNIAGEIVTIQSVVEGTQLIDITNLSDGMYLGEIIDEYGEELYSTFKIIKQTK